MNNYKVFKIIMFVFVTSYIIFVSDLYILPTKSIEEKVALFEPKSVYAGKYKGWVLHYNIYAQSGKVYDFGNLFPKELIEPNSKFIVKETFILSKMRMAITEKYNYRFGNGFFFFLYTITLIIMLFFFYNYRRYIKDSGL